MKRDQFFQCNLLEIFHHYASTVGVRAICDTATTEPNGDGIFHTPTNPMCQKGMG